LAAVTWFGADRISGSDGAGDLIPVWNGLVRLGLFLIVSTLLVAVRDLVAAQRRDARVDALTGVLNPRGFRERAEIELERAARTGWPFSIAYIDLDHFKRLNDSRGHSTGDEALRRIGQTLRECVRDLDIVGRVGGDEFAVVLPESDPVRAETAVQRIRMRLRSHCAEFDVDVSVGVVTFHVAPSDLDTALRRADP
jgi:two-component system cell cycle response regulator